MSVVEAGLRSGKERLDELGLAEFRQEAEGVTSNELVGVL